MTPTSRSKSAGSSTANSTARWADNLLPATRVLRSENAIQEALAHNASDQTISWLPRTASNLDLATVTIPVGCTHVPTPAAH